MGKISKYSNLYNKDGNFLHKLGNYSIQELEELIDTLDKNSKEFANATAILMHMYEQMSMITIYMREITDFIYKFKKA